MSEAQRQALQRDRVRQNQWEAAFRAEPLLRSAAPAPAAFHTDRPVYRIARDSTLTVLVTYVNRMADTTYLPIRNSEPARWMLELWTGDRWAITYRIHTIPETLPFIRVPPGETLTHTMRVHARPLIVGLLSGRPEAMDPTGTAPVLSGTYRLRYEVFKEWREYPQEPLWAPLAETMSNTFTSTCFPSAVSGGVRAEGVACRMQRI